MMTLASLETTSPEALKQCCANLYESDWAKLLLGDSFHPGGLALTERLGSLLKLIPGQRVLDVASGQGTSAIFLAKQYGCEVVGVDYGRSHITNANQAAVKAGVASLVTFQQGDAESLPFAANEFDAIICECAFCTFPSKATAVAEFKRVLKLGGVLGLSDLTRSGPVPAELNSLLAWLACIADAQPAEQYRAYLQTGGFTIKQQENHDDALKTLVQQTRLKLIGTELLVRLKKIDLPGADFAQAKTIAKQAETAVQAGTFGYILLIASNRTKSPV